MGGSGWSCSRSRYSGRFCRVVLQHPGGLFTKDIPLRENDVVLLELKKL
jgi:hypothetical protein